MAFKIYVGNYPTDFTVEDINSLFKDFHGVQYVNSIKKDKKCYSFFVCSDEDQVVEVVTAMNNVHVCGRNLIVRSTDNDLQAYIQGLQQCDSSSQSDFHDCASNSGATRNITINERFSMLKYENNYARANYGEYRDKSNDYARHALSSLGTANNFSQGRSLSKFSLVSVTNFPIGTSERDLFRLFADYNAIEVLMKCNEARRDRTLTEAVICFGNQEDATNAILNLDNTVYRRRVILVNDANDLSVTTELVAVAGQS